MPFVVSDYYSPDGFFGDGETRGQLELKKECPARAPGAMGDCYTVTYRPGVKRFAGIFWQYPHNNWGYWPGHQIAPGATRITFRARGAAAARCSTSAPASATAPTPTTTRSSWRRRTVALTADWTDARGAVPRRRPTRGPAG